MEMKYFRFLYGAAERCLVHYGELQDTKKGETFAFLYLRGTNRQVKQENSCHGPFLFPKHMNLVVLGNTDQGVREVFQKISRDMEIETLIADAQFEFTDENSEGKGSAPVIRRTVRLSGEPYVTEAAGWKFRIRPCEKGSLALIHGLSADTDRDLFEDCVMGVKALKCDSRCGSESSPDGYGCALGCALHQDFDVCKYRGEGKVPEFRTGTLLFGGGESRDEQRGLLELALADVGEPRFFGLTESTEIAQDQSVPQDQNEKEQSVNQEGFRRYFIGTEELKDETVAEICRKGWYSRPVVLTKGEAVCCSGLLKYTR